MAGVTGNTGTIVRVIGLLVVVGIDGAGATTVDETVVGEAGCSALPGTKFSNEDLEGMSLPEAVPLTLSFPGTTDDASAFSPESAPIC